MATKLVAKLAETTDRSGARYVMEHLSRNFSLVNQVEVAEFIRNLGNRYPKTIVRLKLCSLVNGKRNNNGKALNERKVGKKSRDGNGAKGNED